MIKVNIPGETRRIVKMSEMRPYDIGIIKSGGLKEYEGNIVMRDCEDSNHGRILCLSPAGKDKWWNTSSTIEVELFPPGTILQIEII